MHLTCIGEVHTLSKIKEIDKCVRECNLFLQTGDVEAKQQSHGPSTLLQAYTYLNEISLKQNGRPIDYYKLKRMIYLLFLLLCLLQCSIFEHEVWLLEAMNISRLDCNGRIES